MLVPKLLLTPVKIRMFGPKSAKFGLKMAFLAKIGIFGPYGPIPDQKPKETRCVGGFPLFGFQLGLAGLFGALLVGWLVVGWLVVEVTPLNAIKKHCQRHYGPRR